MTWSRYYTPPDMQPWQGRSDAPAAAYFFQIVQPLNLLDKNPSPIPASSQPFAILGFCCDEGVKRNLGRTGAAEGPAALRAALAKLAVHRSDLICYDAGNIHCINSDLEGAQQALGEAVALLLRQGLTPLVIGGGHELAWGHYQGIAQISSQKNLGIVNMDAHFDMRELRDQQGNSGTPFLQIAQATQAFHYYCIGIQRMSNTRQLFDTAEKHHVQIFSADAFQSQEASAAAIGFVQHIIEQHQQLYLTLCMDVLAAAFAPGVSAPQSMGLTPWQIMPLIKILAASGKVISYDIAELCPTYDVDQRTAKLAAMFVYEIMHYHRSIN